MTGSEPCPASLPLCQLCGIRGCLNPDHLPRPKPFRIRRR